MLFSGLPPLVREQDSYRATFTVRNASDGPLEVQAQASVVSEAGGVRASVQDQKPIAISLAAGESKDVGWEVKAPVGADTLRWTLVASTKTTAGMAVRGPVERQRRR